MKMTYLSLLSSYTIAMMKQGLYCTKYMVSTDISLLIDFFLHIWGSYRAFGKGHERAF